MEFISSLNSQIINFFSSLTNEPALFAVFVLTLIVIFACLVVYYTSANKVYNKDIQIRQQKEQEELNKERECLLAIYDKEKLVVDFFNMSTSFLGGSLEARARRIHRGIAYRDR